MTTPTIRLTTIATSEVFTPCQFTGEFYNQSARRINLVRAADTGDFTVKQIKGLAQVVLVQDGKGDFWTAYNESDLGRRHVSDTWLAVGETLVECLHLLFSENKY